MATQRNFQVNLKGMIQLLSDHLYSGPQVYLRELLQNAVDAITARQHRDPAWAGEIRLELFAGGSAAPTLSIQDNGVGLTEEQVHLFLATIGQSSKRESDHRRDFLGQFGIGLLSAFVVSEEIVVITRAAAETSAPVEWRGRADGTYSVRILEQDIPPGTQVFLRAKPLSESFFEPDFVRDTVRHFGNHLPFPIDVVVGDDVQRINETPPWRRKFASRAAQQEGLLEYGRATFGDEFLDAVPLTSSVGGVEGVAFVLSHSTRLASKRTHRVYLKNMLLSEQAENLLPEWAFFVKCVVNATELRPTAARESFYEDESLEAARLTLGQCLRRYLVQLAANDRAKLNRIIDLHYLPIKALAAEDDEFFQMFIDWLPFETSLGTMTLGEFFEERRLLRYAPTRDQFRQMAGIAAAQGLCIVNAGYTYDSELIEKLPEVFPNRDVEKVNATELAQNFEELTLEQREEVFPLVKLADLVLQPYQCAADIRSFAPEQLPTLFTSSESATFLRSIDQTRELADDHWSSMLGNMADEFRTDTYAQLCLNYRNPLIRQLARARQPALVKRTIEMLYVQALLLGHYPLKSREIRLLTDGLMGLIEQVVAAEQRDPPPGADA